MIHDPDAFSLVAAAPGVTDSQGEAVTVWRVHRDGRRVPLRRDGTEARPPITQPADEPATFADLTAADDGQRIGRHG
jgi:hypothetical protein